MSLEKLLIMVLLLIDTAFIYGPKRSEELVGEVVKEYPREKVQIATKGSHVIKDNGDVVQNNQPDYLKQQVEELRTLASGLY